MWNKMKKVKLWEILGLHTAATKVSKQVIIALSHQLLTFKLKCGLNPQKSNIEYCWILKRMKEFLRRVLKNFVKWCAFIWILFILWSHEIPQDSWTLIKLSLCVVVNRRIMLMKSSINGIYVEINQLVRSQLKSIKWHQNREVN